MATPLLNDPAGTLASPNQMLLGGGLLGLGVPGGSQAQAQALAQLYLALQARQQTPGAATAAGAGGLLGMFGPAAQQAPAATAGAGSPAFAEQAGAEHEGPPEKETDAPDGKGGGTFI